MTDPVWDGITIDFNALKNYGWYSDQIVVGGVAYPRLTGYQVAGLAEVDTRIATAAGSLFAEGGTPVVIGTGAKSTTIATGKGFTPASYVLVYDPSDSTRFMLGSVTAYDTVTGLLSFAVAITADTSGSGTITAPSVALSGPRGALGATGATGGFNSTRTITAKTSAYTIVSGDQGAVINGTSGSFTVSFLTAASAGSGFTVGVKNSGSGTITLDPAGGETIDGFTTITLLPSQAVELVCDGSNWLMLAGSTYRVRQSAMWQGAGLIARTTNGPASSKIELATNKVMVVGYDFDPTTAQYAQFGFGLPNSIDPTLPNFQLSIEWNHPATTTNFGVVWAAQARVFADGDNLDQAFGTAGTVTDTGGNTRYTYLSGAISVAPAGTVAGRSKIIFQLYRDAANGADTLAVAATLTDVFIEFNCVKRGNDA
jgi:hypothetical protein